MSTRSAGAPTTACRAGRRAFTAVVLVLSLVPLSTALRVLVGGSEDLLEGAGDDGAARQRVTATWAACTWRSSCFSGPSSRASGSTDAPSPTSLAPSSSVGSDGAVSIADVGSSGDLSWFFLALELAIPLLLVWHRRLWPRWADGHREVDAAEGLVPADDAR